MSSPDIPESVRQFIFDHIDSAEQLEILFFMRRQPANWWSAKQISDEFRSNEASIAARLSRLRVSGYVQEHADGSGIYRYVPQTAEMEAVLTSVAETYKLRPHKILELIFSSAKKARHFANAFVISQPPKDKDQGDSDG